MNAVGGEDRGQEPFGLGSNGEDVVGVDGDRELARVGVDEGDWVGSDDQGAVAPLDDGGVLADAGSLDDSRRSGLKDPGQQLRRRFADSEDV